MSAPVLKLRPSQYRFDKERGRWVDIPKKKRRPGVCRVFRCVNPLASDTGLNGTCATCRQRLHRANHPAKDAFNKLKSNAKRRGKQVEMTFGEFEKWCHEHGYLDKRGRRGKDFHIDRKKSHLGYSLDNIQIMRAVDNCRKGNKPVPDEYRGDEGEGAGWYPEEAYSEFTPTETRPF